MKNKLKTRQICFILIAYSMAGKLLMLPAQLAYYAKNDLWISVIISYALQTVAVWAVSFLCSKTDSTFFELVEGTFGAVVRKVFEWLFAVFFVMAALLPLCEQKLFVHEIFYDTIPALTVFVPFFFVAAYVGGKALTNTGRTADIMLPLMLAAFAVIFIMSASEANLGWLLPVTGGGVKGIFGGVSATLYHFTDGAVMLCLMGRFDYKSGDCAKITISYVVGGLLVAAYVAVFYSVFSTLAPDQYFAISRSAIFFPALSVTGRLDLLAVYVIEIVMLFAVILYIQLAVQCIHTALNGKVKPLYLSIIVNLLLLVFLIIFNDKYRSLQGVYCGILWGVFAVFTLVIPVLSWVLKRNKGGNGG